MRREDLEAEISKRFLPIQMISFAFVGTVVAIGVLPHCGILNANSSDSGSPYTLIFLSIGLALGTTAFFIKNILFKPKISKDLATDINIVTGSYFVATLVQLALFETMAILGLVAYVLTSSLTPSMVLTVVAVFGIISNLPKKEVLREKLAYSL